MKRLFESLTVGAIAAHHLVESAGGLGLPGEPLLGRRFAAGAWLAAFIGHLAAVPKEGQTREMLLGFANGAYQALALQHYVDWPWELRRGFPVLTEAEGLPESHLPAYNTALLTAIGASTAAVGTSITAIAASQGGRTFAVAHIVGLATLPLQLASARHHVGWWRTYGR